MIFHGIKAARLCNAAFSPSAAYVSERAKEKDDIGTCLRLLMRSGHFVLAALAFLHLARSGVVH